MLRIDVLITSIIVLGALGFLIGTLQLEGVRSTSSDPGAAYWPRAVLVLLLAGGLLNLVQINRRRKEAGVSLGLKDLKGIFTEEILPTPLTARDKQYFGAIVLITAYIAILDRIGFLVSTALFLFAFVWHQNYRSPLKATAFSILVTLVVFIVFRNFMNISLPYGIGVFRELGIFVEGLV
ncbi:tripartite tricarboxylate transporter TctB family protein (plasmid) [Haloferacaceae archaeon DSL9]